MIDPEKIEEIKKNNREIKKNNIDNKDFIKKLILKIYSFDNTFEIIYISSFNFTYKLLSIKVDYNTNIIPGYICQRNISLIKNKYYIVNQENNNNDFSIAIYYVDIHQCIILIRKMNEIIDKNNNNQTIQLYIENTNSKTGEVIFLDITDAKIYAITTNIHLEKMNSNSSQLIPKKIFQTGANNTVKNVLHYNSIMSFIDLNPDYSYYYYTDTNGRAFIKTNFETNIVDTYDIFIPGAYKADLLRYCLLYIYGGCYFDCKQILRQPLANIIGLDDEIILCKDFINNGILNAVMMSVAKKDIFMDAIMSCAKNAEERAMTGALNISGPILLYEVYLKHATILGNILKLKTCRPINNIDDYHTDYINNTIKLCDNNVTILSRFYKGYYDNYLDTTHYGRLFNENKIYYKNVVKINNFIKIMVYPNNDDIYEFVYINNKLIIKNTTNNRWNYSLILIIITLGSGLEKNIEVGTSNMQYKEVMII
jgi:mannosyltransferase OCH1-like enzyme